MAGADLAGDVALEAADDLSLGQALARAPLDVVAGRLVVSHPHDCDDVEGAVRRVVAPTAEAVSPGGSSAARRLGCDAAELGEGCFVADPVGVVAGCDEELAGDFDTDPVQLDEGGGGGPDQRLKLLVQRRDLLVEGLPAPGEVAQGGLDAGREKPFGIAGQAQQVLCLGAKPKAAVDQGSL